MVSVVKRFINPVNILIVTALLVLLLNRELFFSEQSESREVKQLLDRVDGVVERMNHKAGSAQVDPQSQRDGDAEDEAPSAEVVISDSEKERPVDARTPIQAPTSNKTVSQNSQVVAGKDSTNAMADQPSAVLTGNKVTNTSHGGLDDSGSPVGEEPSAIWGQARDAAWRGEPEKAVESYRRLIAMQPENFDAYGELGNVLLRMGQTEAAAEAYSQCTLLLNQFGHQQSAWYMLGVVSRLDQEKARELYQKLNPRRNAPVGH